MRAVGLVRVSRESQAVEGWSPETQRQRMKEFAAREGWELRDEDIFEEHESAYLTGKEKDRSGLISAARLLQYDEDVGVLLVVHPSRLYRRVEKALAFLRQVHDAGKDVVSLDGALDTRHWDDPVRWIMMVFTLAFAEWESRQTSAATRVGVKKAMEKGVRPGQLKHFTVGEDGVYRPDEVLLEMVRLRDKGYSMREIAEKVGEKFHSQVSRSLRVYRDWLKRRTDWTVGKKRRPGA